MNIRLFGLSDDSIVDGPGIRFSIFVQGCPHNCIGCHNPDSHDFSGGTEYEVEYLLDRIKSNKILDGVTFSGGEPFAYAKILTYIANEVHKLGLNIVCYTGYTFDELLSGASSENGWLEFLESINLLVDGRFLIDERSIELTFKGSKNQRIIDVAKSLKSGCVALSLYDV